MWQSFLLHPGYLFYIIFEVLSLDSLDPLESTFSRRRKNTFKVSSREDIIAENGEQENIFSISNKQQGNSVKENNLKVFHNLWACWKSSIWKFFLKLLCCRTMFWSLFKLRAIPQSRHKWFVKSARRKVWKVKLSVKTLQWWCLMSFVRQQDFMAGNI